MAPAADEAQYPGYFGKPTATIDWCEGNYEVSFYVAEFWNTVSNLWILLPPILGIIDARRQGFEERFLVGYVSLIIIGVGSTLFHMTLNYEMQLLDEIPMIYGTAAIGYCMYEIRKPMGNPNWWLAGLLFAYCLVFTVSYLAFKEPYIHEAMFLFLAFSLIYLAFRMNLNSYSQKCIRLFASGIIMYFLGGVVWNLDNHICPQLTYLRQEVLSKFLAPASQLHAWWHFFSGYGTYVLIVAFIGYRQKFLQKDFDVHYCFFGPVIRLRDASKAQEKVGGSIKNDEGGNDDPEQEELVGLRKSDDPPQDELSDKKL